jgi:hypothetical protein
MAIDENDRTVKHRLSLARHTGDTPESQANKMKQRRSKKDSDSEDKSLIKTQLKVKQSRYTPWRRMGGEEVQLLLILKTMALGGNE